MTIVKKHSRKTSKGRTTSVKRHNRKVRKKMGWDFNWAEKNFPGKEIRFIKNREIDPKRNSGELSYDDRVFDYKEELGFLPPPRKEPIQKLYGLIKSKKNTVPPPTASIENGELSISEGRHRVMSVQDFGPIEEEVPVIIWKDENGNR